MAKKETEFIPDLTKKEEFQRERRLISGFEKLTIFLVFASFALMFVVQFTMANENIIPRISGKISDTEPITNKVASAGDTADGLFGTVVLRVNNYEGLSELKILVDGKVVADFREPQTIFQVTEGSIVSLDSKAYNQAFEIELVRKSQNIADDSFDLPKICRVGTTEIGRILFK